MPEMILLHPLCTAEDQGIADDAMALKGTDNPKLISAGQVAL